MDQFQLAGLMKRLNVHMDTQRRADGLTQHRFDAAPFGSAYVTISLAEQGPYASSNFNRDCGIAVTVHLINSAVLVVASRFHFPVPFDVCVRM